MALVDRKCRGPGKHSQPPESTVPSGCRSACAKIAEQLGQRWIQRNVMLARIKDEDSLDGATARTLRTQMPHIPMATTRNLGRRLKEFPLPVPHSYPQPATSPWIKGWLHSIDCAIHVYKSCPRTKTAPHTHTPIGTIPSMLAEPEAEALTGVISLGQGTSPAEVCLWHGIFPNYDTDAR